MSVQHARASVLAALLLSIGSSARGGQQPAKQDEFSVEQSARPNQPPASEQAPPLQDQNPLLGQIEAAFRKAKADIEGASLISVFPYTISDSMAYLVLARARGPHRGWQRLTDVGELYAVFWVDRTLTRPTPPIDLFPTRRLMDYKVWLEIVRDDSLVVCARGEMYGDAFMKRVIPIEPGPDPFHSVRVDTSYRKSGEIDAFCGPTSPDDDLL